MFSWTSFIFFLTNFLSHTVLTLYALILIQGILKPLVSSSFFQLTAAFSLSFSFLYCCVGLTKDGNNENIDSLEEVLNILAEESSDWFYGFLSFLYDVMTPFEIIEEEENDAADDVDGTSQKEGVQGKTCVIVDLQNQ